MAHLIISSKDIRTLDGLYFLNDLHKVSGASKKHQPANFLRLETTEELITEIENSSDLRNLAVNKNQGRSGGTWVCKELVYAYATWISAKFHLHVIRSFDQAQQPEPEPEPEQQSLPAPIQDDEKLKLINDVTKSLGIAE
ncbi:KilA-N domain-containing protein [Marinomonas sp.]|uniref:KilA-N domain-containing protein n=1 Tax=Marinomonas sp. TaxID=1904862 RepID=UPI003A920C4E